MYQITDALFKIYKGEYGIQEFFFQFIPLKTTTGNNVTETILHELQKRNIDTSFLGDKVMMELHQ